MAPSRPQLRVQILARDEREEEDDVWELERPGSGRAARLADELERAARQLERGEIGPDEFRSRRTVILEQLDDGE